MNVYVVFLVAQVSNACLFSLYMAAHLYRSINWQVRVTIGELCALDYVKNESLKQNVFKAAVANLSVLSRQHFRVTEFVQGICYVFGVPLALINLNQFLLIISRVEFHIKSEGHHISQNFVLQIYFVYVSAVLELRNEFKISVHRYINSVLYLLFEIIHFVYLISAAELAKKRAAKTMIRLNEFFAIDVDHAVAEKIKCFSSELSINKLDVSLYGLYSMDFTFLFSMTTAIALKLIVLVQIQLKE
nr:uncharacterized protein LOC109421707 [Aedes albopictus]